MRPTRAPGAAGGRPVPRWVQERQLPGRRLFVAVPLPPEVRDDVAGPVERVRADVADGPGGPAGSVREVRWVRTDGLHLTIRFLGPTLDDRLAAVEAAVRTAARGAEPFAVRIAGGGAFPDARRPRVLWLGVIEGAEGLGSLAGALGEALAQAGWPRDARPFRSHLTLARSDGVPSGPRTAGALIAAAGGFDARWTADRLVLFESHTGGGPARYEPLLEVPLGG